MREAHKTKRNNICDPDAEEKGDAKPMGDIAKMVAKAAKTLEKELKPEHQPKASGTSEPSSHT